MLKCNTPPLQYKQKQYIYGDAPLKYFYWVIYIALWHWSRIANDFKFQFPNTSGKFMKFCWRYNLCKTKMNLNDSSKKQKLRVFSLKRFLIYLVSVYIQNFQYVIFMNNLQTLYKITEIFKIPVSEVILIIILQSKKWIQTTRT